MSAIFSDGTKALFARHYPEQPHRLHHGLGAHPLLERGALAALAESLPAKSIEYNPGSLPVGIAPEDVPESRLSIGETIRSIDHCDSWAVLKNIEQDPDYAELLHDLLAGLKPLIERVTGPMLRPQGFVFLSSPGAVTPYHFDPEHNILLQLEGEKTMTVFPAGDRRYAPAHSHETYHTGGHRNLVWHDEFAREGGEFPLGPGEAVYVPVMAPHFVKNGDAPSLSLSITWRSEWSFAEADAHSFNHMLRRFGLDPAPPGRFPRSNRAKAYAWRAISRVRRISGRDAA